MTKVEFLQELYNYLSGFSPADRDEIIQDFEEHFSAGLELGKSEEQICEELGTPYSCAMQYVNSQQASPSADTREQSKQSQATVNVGSQTSQKPNFDRRNKTLWTGMFIFLVLCAFGVYPASVALMFSPILVAIGSIFSVAPPFTGAMIGFLVSFSVMLFSAGLLAFAVMTYLLRLSFRKAGL